MRTSTIESASAPAASLDSRPRGSLACRAKDKGWSHAVGVVTAAYAFSRMRFRGRRLGLPGLMLVPLFLQKYITSGLIQGSVKG